MAKSYYQNGNFIVPFVHIIVITDSRYNKYELEIHTVDGKSYGIFREQAEFLKSQYTAWLDSKANNNIL